MPDHVHMLISIPPKYSVICEWEKLDLDCAERGTQAAQLPGPQILGEGILCFDCREGRGDDPHLHQNQEMADKQLDQLQLKLASS
jgi:hypothetical protein